MLVGFYILNEVQFVEFSAFNKRIVENKHQNSWLAIALLYF